ncbi:MAG: hypothetical protein J7M21_00775, partial [Planctomycetes bacterium]|nr:hypothetical protein [Planctomycetota bacterium]
MTIAEVEQRARRVRVGRLRGLVGKVLRGIILAAYAAAFAEVYLRLFSPAVIMPRYVVDAPYGVRVNMPNMAVWHKTPDYRVLIRTNSRGVRAHREIPYQKPPGEFRVVALGDSFTLGYGVDIEDGFLAKMAERLRENGIHCEVINLAVSGHSTTEELIVLEEEGMKYHPDLVLVGWHKTDLEGNIRTGLYKLDPSGRPVRAARRYLPAVAARKLLYGSRAYRFIAENSHLYCKLREWASDKVLDLIDTVRHVRSRLADRSGSRSGGPKGASSRPRGSYAENFTIALLREMQKVAAAGGARLVVLDVPSVRYLRSGKAVIKSYFPRRLADGLAVYSPIDRLRQAPIPEMYWQHSAGHWTPKGCRAVGQGLAEYVLRMLKIPSP